MTSLTYRKLVHDESEATVRIRVGTSKSPLKSSSPIKKTSPQRQSSSILSANKAQYQLSPNIRFEKIIETQTPIYRFSQDLYLAKCRDLNILPVPEQEKRFFFVFQQNAILRKIVLPEHKLSSEFANTLSKILCRSNYFSYIDISRNKIGDDGMKKIVKSVLSSYDTVHLDISSNDLSQSGCGKVLELLSKHETLYSLDISSHQFVYKNKVGPNENLMKILKCPTLAYLNLSGTNIGSEGMKYIILGLENNRTLSYLNIGNNSIKGNIIKEFVQVLVTSKVSFINLENNLLEEIAAQEFAFFFSGYYGYGVVTCLHLGGNLIPTIAAYDVFESLVKENYLESLSIENNNFLGHLDVLQRLLYSNRRLKYLNLSNCKIKIEAFCKLCDGLGDNKSLVTLIISGNNCKDPGANYMGKAISHNTCLKVLDLSSNGIRSPGGLSLALSLKTNKSLKTLILNDNELKDDVGEAFYHSIGNNYSLTKLRLQLNPMSAKYSLDIQNYLERNKFQDIKQEALKIKESREKFKTGKYSAENVKSKIIENEIEKTYIEGKIDAYMKKMSFIKQEEEKKLESMKQQVQEYREKNILLSKRLQDIQQEIRVIFNQFTSIIEEKSVREYEQKIKEMNSAIITLETKSII